MSDDNFDDGLVHGHVWATEPVPSTPVQAAIPATDTRRLPTPSTVHQDEHVHPCG